ncbi:MAG: glycosyltransferase family 4 protein [Bacteroidales bacterium]|jgi:glycosyltransferase involved in cell wall biosynthesis|nr:glycosyltransferase family 4 protein [Bacteroidales bacterium]
MKILMVLESEFPPDLRVENEMNALVSAGHVVHLACSTRKNSFPHEHWNKAVIHRKPISTFIYKSSIGSLKFPIYFRFWRKFVFSILRKENFDVIHIHDLPLSRIGVEVKLKFDLKLIIDLHENWPALLKYAPHTQTLLGRLLSSNSQWISYEKQILPEADMVITIIEEAKDRIASLGIKKEKICIVSNTIDINKITIPGAKKRNKDFVIFYGGGINRHRGLQVVLEAIHLLKKSDIIVWFHVLGSGSYKTELENLASSLEIDSQVKFAGQKPFKEMMELLAEADAAIIPHLRTENNDASSPNKLYQYMFLKKPVIASDCISLKRILAETDAGFTYRNDSPGELAALLEKLMDNRSLLEQKGENGRRAVLSKYNWDIDKSRLTAAYSLLEKEIV